MKLSHHTFLLSLASSILASAVVSLMVFSAFFSSQTISSGAPQIAFSQIESRVATVAKQVSPSVVSIVAKKDVQTWKSDPFGFFFRPGKIVHREIGGGTGIFITKGGLILTNKHVVADPQADYSVVAVGGREFSAHVKAFDPATDLAILQADMGDFEPVVATFVPQGGGVNIGNFVVAIGNALAQFQNSVTFGIVSGLERTIKAAGNDQDDAEDLAGLIQTDATINPGNSGGPLVDLAGRVVGINTAISSQGSGIGFAIPLTQPMVDYMIQSVQKTGSIRRAFFGVHFLSLDPETASRLHLPVTQGDYVLDDADAVIPKSPAQKAGIKPGDVITEINGNPLSQNWSIREIVSSLFPGDSLVLKVIRWGKEIRLEAQLTER